MGITGSDVPLSAAVTVTVTVAFVATVTVACVQELGIGREVPASFGDADPDSRIVRYGASFVMTTVE